MLESNDIYDIRVNSGNNMFIYCFTSRSRIFHLHGGNKIKRRLFILKFTGMPSFQKQFFSYIKWITYQIAINFISPVENTHQRMRQKSDLCIYQRWDLASRRSKHPYKHRPLDRGGIMCLGGVSIPINTDPWIEVGSCV
jgi:hypothetical protein